MKKRQTLVPVLVGLIVGQIFAEGELPVSVVNTLRIGYDDNLDRSTAGESTSSYIQDDLDLAFRAALSDRTDLLFRSRFTFHTDNDRQKLDPNIYAILTHSVSPRLLLELSEYFRSGYRTASNQGGRYDYYENTLKFTPSYVLSSKDYLLIPLSHEIARNENEIDDLDYDIITGGLTWKRDLNPQRTWAALHTMLTDVDYKNRGSSLESARLTAEISHTMNPNWRGSIQAGASFDKTSYLSESSDGQNPYLSALLAYEPSPRTRISGEFSHQYKESDNNFYAGEKATELRLVARHDFTAKIMGQLMARYLDSEYDAVDSEVGSGDSDEDSLDFEAQVRYKLNRLNSLVLRARHTQKDYSNDRGDYDQNRIDLGWRVEL